MNTILYLEELTCPDCTANKININTKTKQIKGLSNTTAYTAELNITCAICGKTLYSSVTI